MCQKQRYFQIFSELPKPVLSEIEVFIFKASIFCIFSGFNFQNLIPAEKNFFLAINKKYLIRNSDPENMSHLKFYKNEENINVKESKPQNYPLLTRKTNNFSYSFDKIQQETTNAQLEDSPCTSQALGMSSYEQRENNGLKDLNMVTKKTEGDFSQNLDCVFIKISNHEHPIHFSSVESFEKSFGSVIGWQGLGRLEILALKIVVLQKYCGKNGKIKNQLSKALDEYCELKYRRIQENPIFQS